MQDDSSTQDLFADLHDGDEATHHKIFGLVYEELHGLAAKHMTGQKASHTLGPTALVNEAYLKLCKSDAPKNRSRFLQLASKAMRQILVDHARRKAAIKRGQGEVCAVVHEASSELDQILLDFDGRSEGVLQLDLALTNLRKVDEPAMQLIELRFFGGCRAEDAAEVLGISLRSANRLWQTARAFIRREFNGS